MEIQARLLEDYNQILTIDRIDPVLGYEGFKTKWNCQIMTNSENSKKRWWDWWSGADCPF